MPPLSDFSALWLPALVALPVGAALLIALGPRRNRTVVALALTAAAAAFTTLLLGAGTTPEGTVATASLPWVPSLGLELAFVGDRLSLFFAAAAIGIGGLVIAYAAAYFGGKPPPRRFYGVLLLFMAAMVGSVLADHLIALYLFWELTGVASFLLIGTHHDDQAARNAARQALLVTAVTGLSLLAGLVLLGQVSGQMRLTAILADTSWVADARAPIAIVLILVGALGKSAQLPFHFWLTGAMAAPTPVSAYLHSATMVKLGVYLCARLEPAFAAWPAWHGLLLACGGSTMLAAGVLALFAQDIKAALAFATISALGYLLALYGAGSPDVAALDLFHIGNHMLYKAMLFLVAGFIVHATGQRDLREFGGLARAEPVLAAITLIALGSMIGLPGTAGFVSKEGILRPLLELPGGGWVLAGFCAGTLLKVMFALRFFSAVFLGPPRRRVTSPEHAGLLRLPAGILAGAILILGIGPQLATPAFAHWPVLGRAHYEPPELTGWHGFNPELAVSAALLAGGALLYAGGAARRLFQRPVPRALEWENLFAGALRRLDGAARAMVRWAQVDRPTAYLPCLVLVLVATATSFLWGTGFDVGARLEGIAFTRPPAWRWMIAGLIAAAAIGVTVFRLWTTQLISLSIAGFLLCIFFALLRAPDLALTQILVESLLLVLFVFLLARFPKSAERGERSPVANRWLRMLNPLLAVVAGGGTTIALLTLTRPLAAEPVGWEHLRLSQTGAHAANAVNAIVVDFRALDTLGESMVLIIALLGSLGLLMRFRPSSSRNASTADHAGLTATAADQEATGSARSGSS